jgi:hypothetical protein
VGRGRWESCCLEPGRWSILRKVYCWGWFLSLAMKMLSFVFPGILGDCKVTEKRMALSRDGDKMEDRHPPSPASS